MTDPTPKPPVPVDFGLLRMCARVEQRTRAEFDELREILRQAGHTEASHGGWLEHANTLERRLEEQTQQTDQVATALAEQEQGDPAALAAEARRLEQRPADTLSPSTHTAGGHHAPCPVPQCRMTVRHADRRTTHEPRALPIDPAHGDRPYHCPCERGATLTVGRTARGDWTLRPWVPSRDDREEINLIAHALVTGQAYEDPHWSRPVDTSPDRSSARMVEAHGTMTRTDRAIRLAVQAGHLQRAFELAEQASAAEYAFKLHRRSYNRDRREAHQGGRWQNAEWFWIALSVPVRTRDGESPQPDIQQRFLLNFVAVYDEEAGGEVVANADEIERESGIPVGQDGWTQLMTLLTRVDPDGDGGKPGQAADLHHLIYKEDRGRLTPRPHVQKRYPRALVALEALRRTLIPDRGPAAAQALARSRAALDLPSPDWAGQISVDTAAPNRHTPD